MKTKSTLLLTCCLTLFGVAASFQKLSAQGRVFINEYMPWPGNACGTPSEFVELMNMGPGPVNIGCYILTDGDFSVTIPAGTILQPGQFYVIAGQDLLPAPCTNISMDVTANLNWNTCNCTSGPIPSLGGGFLTDGGSANEQVVLLSPTLQVVDAVARSLPVEPSSLITTSDLGGTCASQTFNLDMMSIQYEIIGESAGRGNSFARRIDGGCGWLKDTQQSGGGTNNTPGDNYALNYSMFITEEINCTGGNVIFNLLTSPASNYFPLDYILGYDANGDGLFTEVDTYTTGVDLTAPSLQIMGLPLGYYSINIGPRQGCDYRNYNFMIGPCAPLNVQLKKFTGFTDEGGTHLEASISGCQELSSVELEVSVDGREFEWVASMPLEAGIANQTLSYTLQHSPGAFYRLNMINHRRVSKYSPILYLGQPKKTGAQIQVSPNPFSHSFQVGYQASGKGKIRVSVISVDGRPLLNRDAEVQSGWNQVQIPASSLPKGIYMIRIQDIQNGESQVFKAMKD